MTNPSLLPSSTNDYAAPQSMPLNKAAWDAAMTDIGARLRGLEAVKASFDALIDEGTTQALAVIQANIEPQLAAAQTEIANLESEVSNALGQVAAILAGTIAASHVNTDSTHEFVSDVEKGLIASAVQPADLVLAAARPSGAQFALLAL